MASLNEPGTRRGRTESRPGTSRRAGPHPVLLGAAAVVAVAIALPLVYLFIRGVGSGTEFWELLFRLRTLQIVLRSALLVAAVTAACILIAVPLAWLVTRTDLPFRRAWAILSALPLVIPSYIGAFLVIVALGPRGMLQQALEGPLGIERLPEIYGFPGALLTLTLLSFPYVFLPAQAALTRMDPSLEEASRSLGHSAWSTFRRITLPLLRPAIASGALLTALYTLSDFGAVSLMRYETFTWAIYLQYNSSLDRILAAGLCLVLALFAAGILLAESRTRSQAAYHRSSSGAARPARPLPLGAWRLPALTFCGGIVLFALVLPMSVLGWWVARGISAGESVPDLWSATANSIIVSGVAVLVVLAASLPVALLSIRFPSRASALLERASHVGFALPGIAVALSLVYFGSQFAPALYQTTALLVFAYLVLFLPAGVGALRTSLLQISPRWEEAGRSLGRGPLAVIRTIDLPLMRPGLIAGGSLTFLLIMKELPATLILGPAGFKTLATSVWSASSEAFFAEAASHALALILVSSVPMALIIVRQRWQSQ